MFAGDGGDIDGLARFSSPAPGLWAHHRPHLLPSAGSPVAAADLCLAAIRRLAGVSRAPEISRVLAREPGGAAAFRDGRALPAAAAGGDPCRRRRVPAALRDDGSVARAAKRNPGTAVPDF